MRNLKFSKTAGAAFSDELRSRINNYFAKNNLSKYGDRRMVYKSIIMLTLFLGPFVAIISGLISNELLLFAAYLVSGIGMAGVGMSVMHDALHGSYSKNRKINHLMGYSINLIGASATIWKVQHNILHHTYTNIHEADDDLHAPFFLRFSPDKKRYWLHRYQYLYFWIFYGFMTLTWVTTRDFVRISRYRRMGFFQKKGEFRKEIIMALLWKLVYFSYAVVLPALIAPMSWWIVVLAFLCMHFLTGLILTVVFQTAHVTPDSDFPQPNENGLIGNNWSIHQLATTCNFAPDNRLLSWFIGGLNYQIEHHLMPNICHLHYRNLSGIVRETAEKYGLPYYTKRTFFAAIADHIKMLRLLGRHELSSVRH